MPRNRHARGCSRRQLGLLRAGEFGGFLGDDATDGNHVQMERRPLVLRGMRKPRERAARPRSVMPLALTIRLVRPDGAAC
eukprot:scaffold5305_cov115-Pinguiococcus_pyrenoidosus.AAC.1